MAFGCQDQDETGEKSGDGDGDDSEVPFLMALLVACSWFFMYTKNRDPPVSPKHVTICGANLTNLAAVSAKPRSFSFATQLHTTSPPLEVSPCLCFSCFVLPLW